MRIFLQFIDCHGRKAATKPAFTGTAWKVEGGNHAWNQYQINGQTYTIDPTNDDLNGVY